MNGQASRTREPRQLTNGLSIIRALVHISDQPADSTPHPASGLGVVGLEPRDLGEIGFRPFHALRDLAGKFQPTLHYVVLRNVWLEVHLVDLVELLLDNVARCYRDRWGTAGK